MHLHRQHHVAEALDEIVAIDLRRRDHEITAFGNLQVEIIGAAVIIALRPLLPVAGQLALVDHRVDQAVIVDVLPGDESVGKLGRLALLLEMFLLVDLGIGNQRLLAEGDSRHDQQQNDIQNGEQQRFHGFPLSDKGSQYMSPKVGSGFWATTCSKQRLHLYGHAALRRPCRRVSFRKLFAGSGGRMSLLVYLDYAGIALFAATGALAASRKQLDLIGFLFFAMVTGTGGGTVRDIVLGRVPVFWVLNPAYILVCCIVGVIVFFTAHLLESRYRLLIWLDAIGLAAYCVIGAAKGLAATGSPTIAIVTGTLTATFGGVLRDLMANEPSVLLRPEIYVTAALIGAGVFTAANALGMQLYLASACGVAAAFAVRGGALWFGWTFPTYRHKPGRHPDDVM